MKQKQAVEYKKIILCLVLMCLILLQFLPVSQTWARGNLSPEGLYKQAKIIYYNLKHSPEKQKHRNEWIYSILQFKLVEDTFPGTEEEYKAVFMIGKLHFDLYRQMKNGHDLDTSFNYFQKIVLAPYKRSLADDALFYQGEIYLEKKDFSSARKSFKAILLDYPDGDQFKLAKKRLRQIYPLAVKKTVRSAKEKTTSVKALTLEESRDNRTVLQKISYLKEGDTSQITIYTSGPVNISQKRLGQPDRVQLSFSPAKMGPGIFDSIQIENEHLENIRVSQENFDTSKLILDLDPASHLSVRSHKENSKIVISLNPQKSSPVVKTSVLPLMVTKDRETQNPPVQIAKLQLSKSDSLVIGAPPVQLPVRATPKPKVKKKLGVPVIVIDPGHGGKDDGAKGKSGLLEKNVNLQVSRKVKNYLEKHYRYKVVLTREDDTFIPVKERGDVANKIGADLFVSIHANAASRRSARGIETYYLGQGLSKQAQETAARENGELVQSVNDDQLQYILSSLISTTKINDSSRLAARVQKKLHAGVSKKYSGVRDLGVKEGPFFVLHDASMPSILVELGFMTNHREEKRLKTEAYLDRLADSIAKGIHQFLEEREPSI